jgi:hypothetical protein
LHQKMVQHFPNHHLIKMKTKCFYYKNLARLIKEMKLLQIVKIKIQTFL